MINGCVTESIYLWIWYSINVLASHSFCFWHFVEHSTCLSTATCLKFLFLGWIKENEVSQYATKCFKITFPRLLSILFNLVQFWNNCYDAMEMIRIWFLSSLFQWTFYYGFKLRLCSQKEDFHMIFIFCNCLHDTLQNEIVDFPKKKRKTIRKTKRKKTFT